MSNGTLLFTLALNSGGFLGPLGKAGAALATFGRQALSIEAALSGVKAIIGGVGEEITKGAGLKFMADQIGTSVGSIYSIQRGLKAVGLDAGSAGQMLFMMNKALGGISESGEPTAYVFSQLGLSIENLKKQNAPQQLQAIALAVGRLNQSSATAAASKIFGRYGAREFLQLAANANDFAGALHRGATQAAIFDRFGDAFAHIKTTIADIKENFSGFYLGITVGLIPAIRTVVDWLDKIDFTKIGATVGRAIGIVFEAVKNGRFEELISSGFMAGIEKAGNFLQQFIGSGDLWEGIWDVAWGAFNVGMADALKGLLSIGDILKAAIETALDSVWEKIAKNFPKLAKMLGLEGFGKAKSFSEHLAEEKSEAGPAQKMLDEWAKSGGATMKQGASEMAKALANATKNLSGPEQEKFKKLLGELGLAWDKDMAANSSKHSGSGENVDLGNPFHMEHTALEKMGFVFRGGAGADPQRQTARNTAKMVNILENIAQKLAPVAGRKDLAISNASAT